MLILLDCFVLEPITDVGTHTGQTNDSVNRSTCYQSLSSRLRGDVRIARDEVAWQVLRPATVATLHDELVICASRVYHISHVEHYPLSVLSYSQVGNKEYTQ